MRRWRCAWPRLVLVSRPSRVLQYSTLPKYKESLTFAAADATVTDLKTAVAANLVGKTVTLHGYLGNRSDISKAISFAPLLSADLSTTVQIVSAPTSDEQYAQLHATFRSLSTHTPVAVTGTVQPKKKPKTPPAPSEVERVGDVELKLQAIQALNDFPDDLILQDDTIFGPEQRHLQIRNSKSLRDALKFRSRAAQVCRSLLIDQSDFQEIETPLLFKSTPEGAREFVVPTRDCGYAYALPQSPQQYKQVLMASGIPRYFQIAKCFRDEDLRADRQPEFSQLDLEMSFATGEDVMQLVERLVKALWDQMLGISLGKTPFIRLKYDEAMRRFGSDKPDTRLGMEIIGLNHIVPADLISKIGPLSDPIVEALCIKVADDPRTARTFVSTFMDSPAATPFLENPDGQPGMFIYDPSKPLQGLHPFGFEAAQYLEETFELESGHIVVLQARQNYLPGAGSTPLGNLRLALHRAAVAQGLIAAPQGFNFLWVTSFPLFTPSSDTPGQGGTAGLSSTHHPFTAPASPADFDLLATDPLQAKADHYDLVVNGVELGGGSRRIHNAEAQRYILQDILKVDSSRMIDFEHLLEALRSGCPPHAGMALGFDRLIAVMLGTPSIREVIAFPKSGKGEDALVRSPSLLTPEQLQTYHLKLAK